MTEYVWRLGVKFNPDQPRVPSGQPTGGRWTRSGAVLPSSSPEEWMNNLSQAEMSAIRNYTWLDSQTINTALRRGEELRSGGPFGDPIGDKQKVEMLDRVTESAPLTVKDMVLNHSTELSYLKRAGKLKRGQVIEEKGFISATDSPPGKSAYPGQHYQMEGILRLRVPKGTSGIAPIANLSQYPQEREFLIGRGKHYRILDVKEPDFSNPEGIWEWVVDAELLP